jgi:hypothetical protein
MLAVDSTGTKLPMSTSGNTINCRIYHAMVAAQSTGDEFTAHCFHATQDSTGDTCGAALGLSANLALVALMAILAAMFS